MVNRCGLGWVTKYGFGLDLYLQEHLSPIFNLFRMPILKFQMIVVGFQLFWIGFVNM